MSPLLEQIMHSASGGCSQSRWIASVAALFNGIIPITRIGFRRIGDKLLALNTISAIVSLRD